MCSLATVSARLGACERCSSGTAVLEMHSDSPGAPWKRGGCVWRVMFRRPLPISFTVVACFTGRPMCFLWRVSLFRTRFTTTALPVQNLWGRPQGRFSVLNCACVGLSMGVYLAFPEAPRVRSVLWGDRPWCAAAWLGFWPFICGGTRRLSLQGACALALCLSAHGLWCTS